MMNVYDLIALLDEVYDALPHGDLSTRVAYALAALKGDRKIIRSIEEAIQDPTPPEAWDGIPF